MSVSVILSTYNRARYLELSLLGYIRQTCEDFEVVVVDDGSTDDTAAVIEKYKAIAPFTIKHLWQENRGFRLAKLRNEGVKASQHDYLVFSDGDCIPKADFIRTHVSNSGESYILGGGHVRLTKGYSEALTSEAVSEGVYEESLTQDVMDGLKWKQRKNLNYLFYRGRKEGVFVEYQLSRNKGKRPNTRASAICRATFASGRDTRPDEHSDSWPGSATATVPKSDEKNWPRGSTWTSTGDSEHSQKATVRKWGSCQHLCTRLL